MDEAINDEKRKAVARFLEDFKAAAIVRKMIVSDREKNQAALIQMGLTSKNREDIILQLAVGDYVSGPEADHHRRSDIWVFGKRIETFDVYIKLQLLEYIPADTEDLVRQPVCISFHIAEKPLAFPLK